MKFDHIYVRFFWVLTAAMLFCACAPSEAKIRQKLIGTWQGVPMADGTAMMITYYSDGRLVAKMTGTGFGGVLLGINNMVGQGNILGSWSLHNASVTTDMDGNEGLLADFVVKMLNIFFTYFYLNFIC